ncbi:WYL domain-containing protein [Ruminococcus sp. HUN007]|uniref:helix-turn-helix transcriptional regulator n=1 Tax=Ruminococcus sp. HUN007 TaxID=1514668 RepID=UPI0009DE57F9|nr:WYL domain-containing protein [Ruminococcus sp. HUN007]
MEHERIICVLEYLSRYSDENTYVSIKQIQDYVSQVGNLSMPAEVTIRRDIDRLTNMGNNIVKKNCDHNKAFYALIDKGFSFNEIRFIVDSISINKFLTSKQKRQLIKKFEGMCSDAEIRQLISRITLNEKCSPSLDLLNNLDLIHRLIAEKRKINFEYGKYDTDKKIKYYHKKRELIPVKVVFFNNRFYLKCYNEETEAWRTYRIDRMKNIESGEVSRCLLPKEEKCDGFIIDMFEPEYYENVTLRVKRVLLDDMMEHFGEYASVSRYSDDGNSVNISVRVGINQRFYLWVMKYGDGIELLSPPKVRSEFLSEVRKMLGAYPDFSFQK